MAHSTARTLLAKMGFKDLDHGNSDHDLACQFLGEPAQVEAMAKRAFADELSRWFPTTISQWDAARRALMPVLTPEEEREAIGRGARSLVIALDASRAEAEAQRRSGIVVMPERERETRKTVTYERSFHALSFDWRYSTFEKPIQKGTGAYASTVGFADLCAGLDSTGVMMFRSDDGDSFDMSPRRAPTSVVHLGAEYDTSRPRILVEVKATPVSGSEILKQMNLYREYEDANAAIVATTFDLSATDADMLRSQGLTLVRLGAKFEAWKKTRGGKATDVEEM